MFSYLDGKKMDKLDIQRYYCMRFSLDNSKFHIVGTKRYGICGFLYCFPKVVCRSRQISK